MKLKVDFEDLKFAVTTAGKAVKGNHVSLPAVKLKAEGENLILSVNDLLGVQVVVPAEVAEEGEFTTAFKDINILSVRKCFGPVNIKNEDDNSLILKYRKGMANTVLTRLNDSFTEIPTPSENAAGVQLPTASLKEMCKDTLFAAEDNPNSNMHALKLDISDDKVDGILKFSITTCDGKSLAKRTSYVAKNGDYTGTTLVLPEHIKIVMGMIGDDDNLDIKFDSEKVFISSHNIRVCMNTLDVTYPDLSNLINNRECSFTVVVNKNDFLETLNCASYLLSDMKEQTNCLSLSFSDKEITVGCTGITQYTEKLEAETSGDLPDIVFFNVKLLKEVVSCYPGDTVTIGGTNKKSPFWLCCGDNEEYIYCAMPRAFK